MTEPAPSTRLRVILGKLENLTRAGPCPTNWLDAGRNASLFTELIKDLDASLLKEDKLEEFNYAKSRKHELIKEFEKDFVEEFVQCFSGLGGTKNQLRYETVSEKLKDMKWLSLP